MIVKIYLTVSHLAKDGKVKTTVVDFKQKVDEFSKIDRGISTTVGTRKESEKMSANSKLSIEEGIF